MRRALPFVSFVLFFQVSWSQIYQPVEKYTVMNGLSHSDITCIFQDRTGFLWIGTSNGLNRFDGNTFVQYHALHYDTSSLSGYYVRKLTEDRDGNIWCATNSGINKISRNTASMQSFYFYSDSTDKIISSHIKDIAVDVERNQMYVLTDEFLSKMNLSSGSIIRLHLGNNSIFSGPGAVERLSYNAYNDALYLFSDRLLYKYNVSTGLLLGIFTDTTSPVIRDEKIEGIFSGIGGECWLFTKQHVWLIDEASHFNEIMSITNLHLTNSILFAFQRYPEEVCFTTDGSIISYNLQNHTTKEIIKYQLNISAGNEITSFLPMDNQIYWIGTTEGLLKINQHNEVFKTFNLGLYPTPLDTPEAIAFDAGGLLWMASETGQIAVINLKIDAGKKALVAYSEQKIKINSLKSDPAGQVICATDNGLYQLGIKDGTVSKKTLIKGLPVKTFCKSNSDSIWFFYNDRLYTLSASGAFDSISINLKGVFNSPVLDMESVGRSVYMLERYRVIKHSLTDSSNSLFSLSQLNPPVLPDNNCILPIDNRMILLGTSYGAFIFYLYDFKVLPNYITSGHLAGPVHSIIQDKNQKVWLSTNRELFTFDKITGEVQLFNLSDGLPVLGYDNRMACRSPSGELCFYGNRKLILFNPDSISLSDQVPNVIFTQVELLERSGQRTINLIGLDTLVIDSKYDQLLFHCAELDFWDPTNNTYKYSLQNVGKSGEWVDISTKNSFYIAGLPTGDYLLKVKGSNHHFAGSEGSRILVIKIVAPIWRSRLAIILYGILFLAFFYLTVLFTTRQLRHLNRQYRERELIAKKVELQKEELTLKNKNITDSINYAKRIQMALMPSTKLFKKFFPDSFILHIPKDIVSGDFYWVNEVDGRVYFAAVDCTGHGVPGAFMSIIGFDLFRRITEIEKKKQPAEILNSLSQGFETIFRDIEDITLRDGMDAAFCAIDPENKVLEFSGAFNPLYLVRDNTITEIKGDRFSVGLSHVEDALPPQQFKDHVIPLLDDDVIYIFTDGYADQFGGPEGKKYKYRRFRHLLLALHQLPMERQVEFLRRSIMDWKGDIDQVDDILIMGIRIHQKK